MTTQATKTTTPTNNNEFSITVDDLAKAGVHLGHRTSKVNAKMLPYIRGVKNTIHLLDLDITLAKLTEALKVIKQISAQGKPILLVGTRPHARGITEQTAKELGWPYVSERWLGGTFTNFEQMRNRINRLNEIDKAQQEGTMEKYTKKEKIKIAKEKGMLEKKFGGIRAMSELPVAIFVLDLNHDYLAAKEAKRRGIKVMALADTNTDPDLADYFIPANDDALTSLQYILGKVKEAATKGKEL